MHILYLHQYFVTTDQRGGTRSYEFARRLVAAGHSVTLVTSSAFISPLDARSGRSQINGINLRVVRTPYDNRFGKARRLWAFAGFAIRSTWASLRTADVDLVFATSTPLTIAIPALAAKLWHRCPMVFEVRDLWPELPIAIKAIRNPAVIWLARRLERAAYHGASRVVALSPGMRDGVVAAGIAPDKVVVIPNACDNTLFDVSPDRGRAFRARHPELGSGDVVVYTGTLGFMNGVEYLAAIAKETAALGSNLRYVVVGDGGRRATIEEEARRAGVLGRNFWIFPAIPKREVPDVLAAATVATSLFIDVPEMHHNSANKLFDALAAGKPLMINYEGWQAEFLRDSGAGIVVPPSDAAAAARKLLAFLADRGRLAAAGEAARVLARTRFDRSLLAAKFQKTLEEAASDGLGIGVDSASVAATERSDGGRSQ